MGQYIWSLFLLINTFFIIIALLIEKRSRNEILREEDPDETESVPSLSVIIPARNEEENITSCIESVLNTNYPCLEVIVVDDESDDQTAAIVERIMQKEKRLRCIRLKREEGWVGKNYALHTGSLNARGDWLLFIDSDVRLYPSSIGRTLRYCFKKKLDMLSISGVQETLTFWEAMIQPAVFHLLNIRYPLHRVNRSPYPSAASGQFILIKRRVYNELGGHSAIKGEILEDVKLAEMVKRNGFRMEFLHSSDILNVRMYSSFHDIFKGWTKNLFFLSGSNSWALLWSYYSVIPWVLVPLSSLFILIYHGPEGSLFIISAIAYILLTGLFSLIIWSPFPKGMFVFFLYPLSFFILFIMFILSWWRSRISGVVEWKGRSYRIEKY